MRAGDRIELLASDLDLEGLGVGRAGSVEVHAEGLLPGERGEVDVAHVSRHAARAWGRSARVNAPSPDRVEPACPAFSRCGGCAWQHLVYPAQLEHKRRRVERALAALPSPPVAPVVASPRQLGYRNKATYVVAAPLALGAYAPRSHEWVDTARCRVVMPAIDSAAAAARAALEESRLEVHDERRRTGHLRYVVVRASRAGHVLVGLVTTSAAPRPALERVAQALLREPAVRGVVWVPNDATSGAILGPRPELLAGEPALTETVAGVAVDVAIDTFLQIHLDQAEALYSRLADRAGAGPEMRAIDLYCGVGAIAFALARRGARVLGLERNPSAAQAAGRAADRAGLDRASFETAPAAELPRLLRDPVDLIVVNPPRQGLDSTVRAQLAAHPPPILAYVSCGPESLGRDLAELTAAGLRIDSVEPFDLMPGTGHVETLVIARTDPARDRS
ncbi:MAG TPA: 23S rRNA (uracil(1939)-C(5))-methyltransferase RlmD [Kofleriaceae bacterium]|nr:23S rRNA (uracil(1939)-C(5))-methyltransferase RlmD [Kofleriaceae bacterium]